MELRIRPYHKNSYPRTAVLIKGPDARVWLREIYSMGLDPENCRAYALPGMAANEIYGCLVVPGAGVKITDIGRNSYMQCLNGRLFMPENTLVSPEVRAAEWEKQFTAPAYAMHLDIGLAALAEEIDWGQLLEMPNASGLEITVPSKGVYTPNDIRSLSIDADEKNLAEAIENQVASPDAKKLPFSMEKIMKGNQKEIDKLLKYLEKHPEKALELGIPLDSIGTSRGGGGGKFVFGGGGGGSSLKPAPETLRVLYILGGIVLLIFFFAFLFSKKNSGGSAFPVLFLFLAGRYIYSLLLKNDSPPPPSYSGMGSAATINSDKFAMLKDRYEKLAQECIAKKDYQKAAGIYLKLLKNNVRAAQVLEEGGYYGEAGAIYLKYCKDNVRAADCFEKGRLYARAIDIYKELNQTEKVADLYMLLRNEDEACRYYEMVADDYLKTNQYVKASLIYRKKMKQPLKAQGALLEGWHNKMDAHNCLNNYFANIGDVGALETEISRFYREELEDSRQEAFLQVIKIEFNKHEELQATVRDMAYEIIAGRIDATPFIASELTSFNPKDTTLTKDILKFKASRAKKDK